MGFIFIIGFFFIEKKKTFENELLMCELIIAKVTI